MFRAWKVIGKARTSPLLSSRGGVRGRELDATGGVGLSLFSGTHTSESLESIAGSGSSLVAVKLGVVGDECPSTVLLPKRERASAMRAPPLLALGRVCSGCQMTGATPLERSAHQLLISAFDLNIRVSLYLICTFKRKSNLRLFEHMIGRSE